MEKIKSLPWLMCAAQGQEVAVAVEHPSLMGTAGCCTAPMVMKPKFTWIGGGLSYCYIL